MKKVLYLFIFIFLCGCVRHQTIDDLINGIKIDSKVTQDLDLPDSYFLNGEKVNAIWNSSNISTLDNEGKIKRGINDKEVTLTLTLFYKNEIREKEFIITIPGIGIEQFINLALETLTIPSSTNKDIFIPSFINYQSEKIILTWTSSNDNVLSADGKVGLIENSKKINLICDANLNDTIVSKTYTIEVIALSPAEKAHYILNTLNINSYISKNINLPTEFAFGINGTWQTSNPNVISNTGKIANDFAGTKEVNLILTLDTGDRRTYTVNVSNNNHLVIDREFNGEKTNLIINNGKLELKDNAIEGTYISEVYETFNFNEAVASWAATSHQDGTVELFVRVRVGNDWSKYISYGEWGLGNQNAAYSQSDSLVRLSADELIIQGGKTANALQYKVLLRRTNTTYESAKLALIATALNIPNYEYEVDTTELRNYVNYEVPKLYQHDVPNIGNSICSPTSSTMLLKYKGHDFSDNGLYDYEHEYIARLFNDYGNNIFGNWVYNTVGMSAFGEISYVKRMYSVNELLDHLDNVGPIAASVKGTMIGESGYSWTTSGHLIVVRGYRIIDDQIYILANDPNLKNVHEEYKVENFMRVWRNIAYIVE